jgi:hypothetical protein
MKYAFSVFILSIFVTFSSNANARSITSFRDSQAILAVAQFMYDVAEDMPVSTRIGDRKLNLKDFSKCTEVSSDEVYNDVEEAIKKVLRFYPDEDIPFEQALVDLEDYIDHKMYKKCNFEKKNAQSKVISAYYVDTSDKIHLRLDNITLTAE